MHGVEWAGSSRGPLCPPVPGPPVPPSRADPGPPAGRTPKVKNVFRFKLDAKSVPDALAALILILLKFSIDLAHRQTPRSIGPTRALRHASSAPHPYPIGLPSPPKPHTHTRDFLWGDLKLENYPATFYGGGPPHQRLGGFPKSRCSSPWNYFVWLRNCETIIRLLFPLRNSRSCPLPTFVIALGLSFSSEPIPTAMKKCRNGGATGERVGRPSPLFLASLSKTIRDSKPNQMHQSGGSKM